MKKVYYTLVLLFMSMTSLQAEKVKLRVNLEKGKTYTLSFDADQDIKQTMNGQEMAMNQSMGFDIAYEVLEKDDKGNMKLKCTYAAVRFKHKSQFMTVDYDSANPPETVPAFAKVFASLLNESITLHMDARGSVSKVEGMQEMIASIMKKNGIEQGMMADQLKKQFSEEKVKEQFSNMVTSYPEQAVGVGDSWTETQEQATGSMKMNLKNTYTVKEIKDGHVVLSIASTITAPEGNKDMEVKGKQSGEVTIKQATGWVTKGLIDQDIDMTMTMNMGETKTEIPMLLKSKIKLSSK